MPVGKNRTHFINKSKTLHFLAHFLLSKNTGRNRMSRNITALLKADPLYSDPDKVLNGQTLVKSDLPFVYMGPAARCAT